MMIKNITRIILRDFHQIFGWKTDRKIIVFESDDWGSIRLPSKEVYNRFKQRGFSVEKSDYNRLDTLESKNDLNFLFEVLTGFKNREGVHPVFTPNMIVANPDFKKIEESGFSTYFYEPLPETLQRYYPKEDVFAVYRQGMDQNLFHPQFHGREHLNIHRWMKRLQERDEDTLFSFQHRSTYSGKSDYSFMEAFDFDSADEIDFQKEVIRDGLNLFEQLFGYRSKSFIPPCYVWDSKIENALKEYGVETIQGGRYQYQPTGVNEVYSKRYHYMGEMNNYGQRFLIRNAIFEPSLFKKSDWVDYSLSTISSAFRWEKPAIISTHRINYMGSLDDKNRDATLKLLSQLLKRIVSKWPDVEFMTSDQLGDFMSNRR
ncbi:MAG: hypothetical protein ACOYOT_05160 [Bacteroidales bacterium]